MQAICFHEHGDPARVLRWAEVDRPSPGDGEVLVRMLASPINPSDLLFIEGHYGLQRTFPVTPGFEGVGVVEAAGGGVLGRWLVRRRVVAINRGGGNWAEYAVIPARQAVPVPAAMSLEQAATFFVNPVTALVMTRHVHRLRSGDWLLQSAAGSALGRMIIRLGQHCDFRTVNIVRRAAQVEELQRLGADAVIVFDASSDDPDQLVEQVTRTSGPVRCAVDPVGGTVGSSMVRCLGRSGRLLTYGTLTEDPLEIAPRTLIGPAARVEGFLLGRWMDQQSLVRKFRVLREARRLITQGVLSTEIAMRIPLADVPQILQSPPAGKLLIEIASGP